MAPLPPQPAHRPGSDPPATLGDLPLEDLAKILDPDAELDDVAYARLARLLRRHPELAAKVAELDTLAAEAGFPDGPWTALDLHRRLDRLLDAEEWHDPTRVLGAPDAEAARIAELIHLAGKRAAGSAEPRRLLELRARLIDAEVAAFADVLSPFARRLITLSPEGADRVLFLASMLYRWRHHG